MSLTKSALLKQAIAFHIKDLNNAEKAYRAAIESGISNVVLYTNLGAICQLSKRADEALGLYKKALQINPYHSDAYTNLGTLHKELGNFDQPWPLLLNP